MKLHLDRSEVHYLITGHGPGQVKVNAEVHTRSLVVLPDEVISGWSGVWSTLAIDDFDVIAMRAPEILLLGTGPRQRFPSPALYRGLLAARIGVEVMDTAAACRTYNILAGEGRRVAAALLIEA